MKFSTLAFMALVALSGVQTRADNFVTITPTAASAATVVSRWVIGSNLAGLGYIDGNSGFGGASATNFFSITGAAVPLTGAPNGFTSYLPSGAATAQSSVGNAMTPNTHSGLTYVAENLSLIGPLSFYTIHHRTSGDYLALIQPGTPTISDQKPMSVPGGPLTGGATGYNALSYAANDAGGWGANLFYYFRTNATGETIFGSLIPALLSGPTDRWNLGAGRGFTDIAYTSTDIGFGFGPSQFYYLRLDPLTQTTFFGRLNPLTGVATDIQNLGGVYRTLAFTTTNVGYGANNFYTIGRASQTIAFGIIQGHTACDAPFTFVAPVASSGLPVTIGVSGPATVSGNTVTLTGAAGTVALTASQAGDSNFVPVLVVQSFVVTACAPPAAPQDITFAPIPTHTACDAPFTFVFPTASSGLAVTLAVSGPATVSGNTVTLTGAVGTVVLTASQAGNGVFAAAAPSAQSFVVSACVVAPTAQTITFAAISSHGACDAPFTFVAPVASSGLPVTIAVSGPATVSGNTVTLTGSTGTVLLTASQAGNTTFAPATSITQTFAVVPCAPALTPQTITFAPVPDQGLCDPVFTVNPTSSSGLPVALVVTSGPAIISGNTVTITGAGSVTLQALQPGNATYAGATPVSRTFSAAKCAATVTLTNLTNIYYGRDYNALEWIVATTNPGGLPVILTFEGNTSVPAAVRSYTVVGTINSPIYAGTTTATLVISADPRVAQTVTFGTPAITNHVFGDSAFTLNPSASSGMPTVLAVLSGPASVAGNTVTLTGAGTVTLEVSQSGHILSYLYAALTQSFVVAKAAVPITLSNLTQPFDGSPKSATVVTAPPGLAVVLTYNGSVTPPSAAGSYAVQAIVTEPNYQGTATGTLVITSPVPAPIITNNPLTGAGSVGTAFSFAIAASGSPTGFTATPLPNGLTIAAATGVISGIPTTVGTFNVLLGATNAGGTGNATVTLTFAPAGVAPVITNNPLTAGATVGAPFSFAITASGAPTAYSATALPSGLGMGANGIIAGTPSSPGISNVLLGATNATGTGYATLIISVAPAGSPPIITNTSLTAATTVGTPFNFSIAASGSPSSYSASALPAGLSIVSATGAITGTPTIAGTSSVLLGATNANGTGVAVLTITVVGAGSAPVITNPTGNAAATLGTPFGFTIVASGLPTSFSASGLPPGLVVDSLTGAITGTPTLAGTYLVTLRASGPTGVAISALTVSVLPATVAPVITSLTTAPGTVGVPFVTYQTTATGLPNSYTATGLPAGLTLNPLTGAINGTPTDSGTSVVTLTASNAAGSSTIALLLTIAPASAQPIITSPPTAAGAAGLPFVPYLIAATGLPTSYSVTGLPAGLALNTTTGAITGTPTFGGTSVVTLVATNSGGTGTAVLRIVVAAAPVSRIVNFSARAVSGPGADGLIMGFVVSGEEKRLLVRGIGPGLVPYGVVNVLADPLLTVFGPAGVLATNDDWQTTSPGQADGATIAATAARVGAFALPNGSRDAAVLAVFGSGAQTASVVRPNGTTGIALTEIYDADPASSARLINVSARINVTAGEGALIAGFVIAGDAPKTVLIRGVGPTLSAFGVTGVLADPTIAIFSGAIAIGSNDNWSNGLDGAAQIAAVSARVGAFALVAGSRDAALLLTLQPGSYTVHVTGVGNTTGIALIEIYDTQ